MSNQTGKSKWIVGHDGSEGATHAARWALAQAAGNDIELSLLRTWQVPAVDGAFLGGSIDEFAPKEVCADMAELTASANAAGVLLTTEIGAGAPARTLLDASEDASMLILGTRGLGGFRRLLLGSVSSQCAAHAVVPTVVVPLAAKDGEAVRRIVVGFDGSERSRLALDWAMHFAPMECNIKVVGAWIQSRSGFTAVAQHYTDELDQARFRFNELLDEVEAGGSRGFERHFAYADPAAKLLDESTDSDLVVVGQRGHSGMSAAVLGSVATHVLHHSTTAVAVVPDAL